MFSISQKTIAPLLIILIVISMIAFHFALASVTDTLRPTADGGEDSNDWKNTSNASCSGVDCYTEVDESSGASCTNSDGDTSYIKSDTNGAVQTFDIDESGVPDDYIISQIDITICARRAVTGVVSIETRKCIDNVCTSSGSSITLTDSYVETTQSHSGLNITKGASTDIEIGVINTSAKTVQVSQISADITYSMAPDTTAPSGVSDLAPSGATTNSIDLDWSAPGDDAGFGTATAYDVRYSTSAINDSNWSSATQATGEPSPSVAGFAEAMTVSGLSANTTYHFAIKTSDEVPNESAISNVPSLATLAEGEDPTISIPTGGGSVAPSKIYLSGQAYPDSKIEVLRKGSLDTIYKNIPVERSVINDDGTFSIIHLGLLGANYLVALRVEDKDGRKTGIISFNVDLASEDLIVEDIFVPPTVGFEDTLVKKGADVHIVGYAAPNNIIELEIGGIKKETQSNASGFYELVMNTDNLDAGSHTVRARQIASSTEEIRTSNFGISYTFKLSNLSVPLADFDKDSKIGITDWSIFLFRWGSEQSDLRSRIDLDGNGIINIADFSIFLRAFSI